MAQLVYDSRMQLVDSTPYITSVLPSSTVHTRLLLCDGKVPNVRGASKVQIVPHREHMASQSAHVDVTGAFIALVPLLPGENEVQLLYYDSRSQRTHRGIFYVSYVPLMQNPPLKLVVVVGSDSPHIYDDAPHPKHAPTLETAIKKFRLAGYMWSAFTAQQMDRNGFGQRTFRLDESWLPDSLSSQDVPSQRWRQTAKVLVLKSKYTTAEIRDPKRAQQNKDAGAASSLFDIALQTLALYPETNGAKEYVAAMFLDAHWDPKARLITGHAALGGGTAQHSLAIFGSHTCFSWPSCLEEVESCFMDAREVDTRYCGVDGEGRRYFSADAVGVGAFMHEVGHLYGCPHQENGVMLRDYPRLHRSFTTAEPKDADAVVGKGICNWHRLDILRFVDHDAFKLPLDPLKPGGDVRCYATDDGIQIECAPGLRCIEIYQDGHEFPRAWLEMAGEEGRSRMSIHEAQLRERIAARRGDSDEVWQKSVRLNIMARSGEQVTVPDVTDMLKPIDLPHAGGKAYKSGWYGLNGGDYQQAFLPYEIATVRVWAGGALDGIEIIARSVSGGGRPGVQLVGKRGGAPHDFQMEVGERITGFTVRSGLWVDGLAVVTDRRRSPFYGNSDGGSKHEITCPPGYAICGIRGEVGDWLQKFGILYTRLNPPV